MTSDLKSNSSTQIQDSDRCVTARERSITDFLMMRYGPLLDTRALADTLKFPSVDALERAIERRQLGVTLKEMSHRRGKFALAHEVAHFLARETILEDLQDSSNDTCAVLGKERSQ